MTVEERTSSATEHTPGLGQQWVYRAEDSPADNKDLLGGKGGGLAASTQAGLPVPPAITITTAACNVYQRHDRTAGHRSRATAACGGDPASVALCHELGLDYARCAPGRVPIARLAAAHAALGHTPTDR